MVCNTLSVSLSLSPPSALYSPFTSLLLLLQRSRLILLSYRDRRSSLGTGRKVVVREPVGSFTMRFEGRRTLQRIVLTWSMWRGRKMGGQIRPLYDDFFLSFWNFCGISAWRWRLFECLWLDVCHDVPWNYLATINVHDFPHISTTCKTKCTSKITTFNCLSILHTFAFYDWIVQ